MLRSSAALFGFMVLTGCDNNKAPDVVSRAESNTALPGTLDFTPRRDVIPPADYLEHTGPIFLLRMNTDGEIFRNDQLTSRSDVAAELLALSNLADVAVIIEVNSDMLVKHTQDLNSYFSDSVPGLGTVTYVVMSDSDDE